MFVNINPAPASAQESVCSLNFAARCRSVQLGQAKKAGAAPTGGKASSKAGEDEGPASGSTTPTRGGAR